jgi:hypothetical protein
MLVLRDRLQSSYWINFTQQSSRSWCDVTPQPTEPQMIIYPYLHQGKTKVPLPICTAPEGPRTKNGGPPCQYIERCVVSDVAMTVLQLPSLGNSISHFIFPQPFTDETRFDKDNPPLHPIQDDSAWYLHSPGRWNSPFRCLPLENRRGKILINDEGNWMRWKIIYIEG